MIFKMTIQRWTSHHNQDVVEWFPTGDDRFWAVRNHGQTLEGLNKRGGMSWCEMAAILEHRAHHRMAWEDAKAAVKAELERR